MSLYVYGDKNVEVPAHLHFGKYLIKQLLKGRDTIAVEHADTEEKLTYKELLQHAVNLASELMKLGIGRGDIVAVGSEKRNTLIITIFAVIFTGATYTAYDLHSGKFSLQHKISVAHPNYFIFSKSFWGLYNELLSPELMTLMTFDDEPTSAHSIKSYINNDVDINSFEPGDVFGQMDIALILYSSGTTGLPKGVRLTHMNCILNSLPYKLDRDITKTIYTCGEWFHNYDIFSLYKFISAGSTIIYLSDVTSQRIVECIDKYKISMAMLVPYLIVGLCKVNNNYNWDSLRIIYNRSAPLHNKTIEQAKQRFQNVQIFQGYGMTECGELTSETWGHMGPKPGSVGMGSPGIILKISDPKTDETLGPNQRGEIRAKGPVLMNDYIGIDPATYLDKDGFLKTGDWGYYDNDNYFYIVDRIKEILNHRGDQVPPLELETILQLHPEVLEAAVVGKYDEVCGDIPTAFVVRQPNAKVTAKELIDYVATEVPSFMQLAGGVIFISKLPRNPRGKVLRNDLRKLLNDNN
ncbi:4-coumarate--CoA ligase 1-like [Pieris napi]|uniref:4-coumarate--CoA ligase 1-like n=1 Tax=Pieris napi TaxID=78633 RepID=UPI001FB90C6A|nr:4-coumarate--CoA ligase 1-like [Pieris napi]